MCSVTKKLGSKAATSQNIYRILNSTKNNKLWPFRHTFDFIFGFYRKTIIFAEETAELQETSSSLYGLIHFDPNFR
jgi:hypothetical protein